MHSVLLLISIEIILNYFINILIIIIFYWFKILTIFCWFINIFIISLIRIIYHF